MAATPPWKIYRDDAEYVAACKYPEDAAALVAIVGGTIRYEHKLLVWTEGAEEFSAGESYDSAAEVMNRRVDERAAAARARRAA